MSEYPFPFFDEEGKVNCQICGKSYLVIVPRHLATHDVVYSEYKLRFPGAPLSSEEFDGRSKFGKEKQIFVKDTLAEIEDEVYVDEEPEIEEEINLEQILVKESDSKSQDICNSSKDKILDHLRSFFMNIRKDHMIRIFSPDGRLLFESISDFADPVLKIDIEFPKTFWHNEGAYINPNRKGTLEMYGWKIIEINSVAPTFKQISKAISSS